VFRTRLTDVLMMIALFVVGSVQESIIAEADRLKISLREVLQMEEWEYNHWLGYLMLENEEHREAMNKTR